MHNIFSSLLASAPQSNSSNDFSGYVDAANMAYSMFPTNKWFQVMHNMLNTSPQATPSYGMSLTRQGYNGTSNNGDDYA